MVLGINQKLTKAIWSCLLLAVLSFNLLGCSDRPGKSKLSDTLSLDRAASTGMLREVAPPEVIQQLDRSLEKYQPQIAIVSPEPGQTLPDTNVKLQVKVQNLPIFKDPELQIGPHLNVILDNQPYLEVYDTDTSIVFENTSPGTHTLRVFAARPWNESFKNEGAYAETTFNVISETKADAPDPTLPLLTYSEPQGDYGAEPILLDFYLTHAPINLAAQENSEDKVVDWQIRATVNGESFLLDTWQPIYLKGFQQGKNWVQLELIDKQGNKINNIFNDTVRLFNYEPNTQNPLSKILRGEIPVEVARAIVDPNYKAIPVLAPPVPQPIPTPPIPTPPPTPAIEQEKTPGTEVEQSPGTKEELEEEKPVSAQPNEENGEKTPETESKVPSLFKEAKKSEKLQSPELEDVVDLLPAKGESTPEGTVAQPEEAKPQINE